MRTIGNRVCLERGIGGSIPLSSAKEFINWEGLHTSHQIRQIRKEAARMAAGGSPSRFFVYCSWFFSLSSVDAASFPV